MYSGAPYYYDYINGYNGNIQPSTVHIKNTALARYFKKYLLQKAISVFKWEMPDTWARDYFLYCLYGWGFVAIVNTDKYGVIPQACGLRGHDIFYRPTHAVITNRLLRGTLEPRINTQCVVLKLQPDYCGILDIIDYYGDLLALCAETVAGNLLNSKLSYVFTAQNKTAAESFKKLFDKITSGEPMAVIDKNLMREDGSPAWQFFSQNVGENYIVSDILADMRKIETMFDTDIGIPNANTDKRERLIVDEVNANNTETRSRCELWLDNLETECERARKMFGINLFVKWREGAENVNINSWAI